MKKKKKLDGQIRQRIFKSNRQNISRTFLQQLCEKTLIYLYGSEQLPTK